MPAAIQRQTSAHVAVSPPPVGDLVGIFVKRNPDSPRNLAEIAGRVAAALGGAAVQLTLEQQRQIVAHKGDMPRLIAAILADLPPSPALASDAEDDEGEGLDPPISLAEGRRRLRALAPSTTIEAWAGPVAGPSELERVHGIPRSTLHDWQKHHAVIGLLKGVRKHVFPLAQFVDGRPLEGLGAVAEAAASPRTAWLWLIEPHPSLGSHTPLGRLKAGKAEDIIALAKRDFGQS